MSLHQVKTRSKTGQSFLELRERMAYDKEGNLARMCYPFAVRLPVKMSNIHSSLDYVDEVFLYHNDPNKVAYKALALWNHWIRIKANLPEESFPKVQNYQGVGMETLCEIISMEDSDFEELWKTAKKVKHFYAGHPEHPAAFMVPSTGKSIII
jgi:hypothetical protein